MQMKTSSMRIDKTAQTSILNPSQIDQSTQFQKRYNTSIQVPITITGKDADANLFKESCPNYTDNHAQNLLKVNIQFNEVR